MESTASVGNAIWFLFDEIRYELNGIDYSENAGKTWDEAEARSVLRALSRVS